MIGPCGGPRDDAGFEIAVDGATLTIGRGRYYVDGLLVENDVTDLVYADQPDRPAAAEWANELQEARQGIVYLDAWERHVTPLDDARIREVALDGPDTATRVRTVWQVRVLPIAGADPAAEKDLLATRAAILAKLADLGPNAKPATIAQLQAQLADVEAKLAALGAAMTSCADTPDAWAALIAEPDGTLDARTVPPAPTTGPCIVPPTAGYRRLENQLYRVEVHTAGTRDTATVKWSRDNATVVAAIERIDEARVVVDSLGPDDVLGFGPGQWVELTDDRVELEGQPGILAQIDTVNDALRQMTLTQPMGADNGGLDLTLHPKVRRWDQSIGAGTAGVAMTADWLLLEDGVEVKFGEGSYRSGDYWLIPARTATGEIEWPPYVDSRATTTAQPRRGIEHHFCRLAVLTRQASPGNAGDTWQVEDCRKLFPPLTDLPTGAPAGIDALHVEKVETGDEAPLDNDARITPQQLASGLIVVCDDAVEAGTVVDGKERPRPTCLVTLDLPFPSGPAVGAAGVGPIGTVAVTLSSRTAVSGTEIRWRPDGPAGVWLTQLAPGMVKETPLLGHLTLKGNFIHGASRPRMNLDGEVFGRLTDGDRLGVTLPSGDAVRGGDLEMWFWLATEGDEPPPPPTDHIVIAPATQTKRIPTDAFRAALSKLLFSVIDRKEVASVIDPTFAVDVGRVPDLDTVHELLGELKIDQVVTLQVATEDRFTKIVEVINHDFDAAQVRITLSLVVVVPDLASAADAFMGAEQRVDLVIGSESSVGKLAELTGKTLSLGDAFPL